MEILRAGSHSSLPVLALLAFQKRLFRAFLDARCVKVTILPAEVGVSATFAEGHLPKILRG
jgi:hypothetical protein